MDGDGEIEVSEHVLGPNSDSSSSFQASLSSDPFLDDLLRNYETCNHTHTCNPPGPDAKHTHTCYHTHTRVIPSEEDEKIPISRQRRHLGNREAVRKYREKKKAQAAHLEEEAKKLRLMNQVLMEKLEKRAFLEAEILRLRTLLLGIQGKVDDELSKFPFPDQCNSMNSSAGTECVNNLGCSLAGAMIQCEANIELS
ncbi:basic leucine zipper 23 [Salvia hispanica]|uniref:basic leucine zipper 23 n=1 Tax=Salvia hispanica TaxID=49212 RepID=UPI00200929AA|nr:basic leucine zipper 23 [Salvia hispanica]XP_047937540.1 basic leucine zipper 23 [Salvia hispanica]XP_047937541.1 basic leucine zipper 23 [Salvia hispanica]